MPALIRYGIDNPNVPLVPCGRHKGVVIIAAAAGFIDTLYLALSRYFLGVFVSCAAPCLYRAAVPGAIGSAMAAAS